MVVILTSSWNAEIPRMLNLALGEGQNSPMRVLLNISKTILPIFTNLSEFLDNYIGHLLKLKAWR